MRRRSPRAQSVAGEIDGTLERRLAQLFGRLLLDIVRMGAGEDVEMPYVDDAAHRALDDLFAGLHALDVVAQTQFSEPLALGVAYVSEDEGATIWVEVDADEWTAYEGSAGGWARPLPCRRRRLVAEVDAACSRILRLGRGVP